MSDDNTSLRVDDAELDELQHQVNVIQEDINARQIQEAAAREEGNRKMISGGQGPTKNTSVFVGGIDPRTTDADLKLFFSSCGPIRRVTILKDKSTGLPKGTCYVEFENEESMSMAVAKDGQAVHGKPLKIAVKRDNVPYFMRGSGPGQGYPSGPYRGAGGPPPFRGGRGGMPGQYPPQQSPYGAPPAVMQQQMMQNMMMMMGGAPQFTPYGAPRGGRGFGRGGPYVPGGRGRPY